jgi:hypothetical protein
LIGLLKKLSFITGVYYVAFSPELGLFFVLTCGSEDEG